MGILFCRKPQGMGRFAVDIVHGLNLRVWARDTPNIYVTRFRRNCAQDAPLLGEYWLTSDDLIFSTTGLAIASPPLRDRTSGRR
jgi:hypothetical protein